MPSKTQLYKPGQVVKHRRYAYHGVIVEADPRCLASDEWYNANQTQPDRDQPWYHVLVSGSDQATYPAQTSLLPDESCQEVDNPLIPYFFSEYKDGHYARNSRPWPEKEDLT